MIEDPVKLKEILEDVENKAKSLSPNEFLEHVDKLVELSRNHIQSSGDERIRESLLKFYQGIISYAFACHIQALSIKDTGIERSGLSASC